MMNQDGLNTVKDIWWFIKGMIKSGDETFSNSHLIHLGNAIAICSMQILKEKDDKK